MPCCVPIVKAFINQTATVVPITSGAPVVRVYYKNTDNTWTAGGVFTQISIIPGVSVTVDHGGPATGVVKVHDE